MSGQEIQIYKVRETEDFDLQECHEVFTVPNGWVTFGGLAYAQHPTEVGKEEKNRGNENPASLNTYYMPGPMVPPG